MHTNMYYKCENLSACYTFVIEQLNRFRRNLFRISNEIYFVLFFLIWVKKTTLNCHPTPTPLKNISIIILD